MIARTHIALTVLRDYKINVKMLTGLLCGRMRVTGVVGGLWGGGGAEEEVDVEAQFPALTPGTQHAAQPRSGGCLIPNIT